ncbi:MAG TPA: tetratricopeptide repeat protein [Candidatus Obscuribacterales bacterium]
MKLDTIDEVERFLSIQEQALGGQSPEVAKTLAKLADLYAQKCDVEKARTLYTRALDILERVAGPHRASAEDVRKSFAKLTPGGSSPSSVNGVQKLAAGQPMGNRCAASGAYAAQGDENLSAPAQSLRNLSSVSGAYASPSSSTRDDLPPYPGAKPDNSSCDRDSLDTQKRSDPKISYNDIPGGPAKRAPSADVTISEALAEIELLKQMVGPCHIAVADSLTQLADLYCRRRMYSEMEPVLVKALKIREAVCGPEHPSVSTELKNLARLYEALNKYTQAESLYKRAIAIRSATLGKSHPKTIDVKELYGKLLRKTGRLEKAEQLENEVEAARALNETDERYSSQELFFIDSRVL